MLNYMVKFISVIKIYLGEIIVYRMFREGYNGGKELEMCFIDFVEWRKGKIFLVGKYRNNIAEVMGMMYLNNFIEK